MSGPSAAAALKRKLLSLIRAVPRGRVATYDDLARHMQITQPLLLTLLNSFSEDERDIAPWHRLVAKGGALGRGPHRDAHFARLVREGVPVSPAGVVQDLPRLRVAATALSELALNADAAGGDGCGLRQQQPEDVRPPAGRSCGMKDRPRDNLG